MIDKEISKFIWQNKPPKIKATVMISSVKNGGLNMPHFQSMISAQKVMWVKRLLSDENEKWKNLALKLLNLKKFDLKCKSSIRYYQSQSPSINAKLV